MLHITMVLQFNMVRLSKKHIRILVAAKLNNIILNEREFLNNWLLQNAELEWYIF